MQEVPNIKSLVIFNINTTENEFIENVERLNFNQLEGLSYELCNHTIEYLFTIITENTLVNIKAMFLHPELFQQLVRRHRGLKLLFGSISKDLCLGDWTLFNLNHTKLKQLVLVLCLEQSECIEEILRYQTELEILNVVGIPLNSSMIQSIGLMNKLNKLAINTRIINPPIAFEAFHNLTNLQDLIIDNCNREGVFGSNRIIPRCHHEEIDVISKVTTMKLTRLYIIFSEPTLPSICLERFATNNRLLENIRVHTFPSVCFSSFLKNCKKLKVLKVHYFDEFVIPKANFKHYDLRCKSFKNLNLEIFKVNTMFFDMNHVKEFSKNFPNLKVMQLMLSKPFTKDQLKSLLLRFKRLRSLYIKYHVNDSCVLTKVNKHSYCRVIVKYNINLRIMFINENHIF